MRKLFVLMLCCFAGFLFVSCGGGGNNGESSGESCETSFDCPLGQTCSGGRCVKPGEGGSGEGGSGGEFPDGGNGGSEGGNSGSSDSDSETNDSDSDSDSTNADDKPITGPCELGDTQKCEYQGPAGTENVGQCKASIRACKEDGSWGRCEGEVLPVTETGDLCSNGIDDDCDGMIDNGKDDICTGGTPVENEDTDEEIDDSDVEHCDTVCVGPGLIENDGCKPAMTSEAEANLCNGQDDDCDGKIDEGCPCTPGTTQSCFSGKPANRGIGTCHDGTMTCKVPSTRALKGDWGDSDCIGDIKPTKDICNKTDDNCNGCADEGLCCSPKIDCTYDIGTAKPFVEKIIDGKKIYDPENEYKDADNVKWEWTLTKGACDIVLNTTSFKTKGAKTEADLAGDGAESAVVSGVGLSQFKVKFMLSGTYNLNLKVTREGEDPLVCNWPLKVESDGLRVELCWDTAKTIDVDLHMGKNDVTTAWDNSSECYWRNCDTSRTYSGTSPSWNYGNTINSDPNDNGAEKSMPNPRLDLDNRGQGLKPENINLDNPNVGDAFKVLVYHYSGSENVSRPVVNIYCGGTPMATFGGIQTADGGFTYNDNTKEFNNHDSWKVVEVTWLGEDPEHPEKDQCELAPNDTIINEGFPSSYTDW